MPTRVKKRLSRQVVAAAHKLNAVAKAVGAPLKTRIRMRWFSRNFHVISDADAEEWWYEGVHFEDNERWFLVFKMYAGQLKASRPRGKTKEQVLRTMLKRIAWEQERVQATGELTSIETGCWRP